MPDFMDYLIALLGLLLLVLPTEMLTRRKLHNIALHDIISRPRYRFAWLHWVNFADFLRAFGGVVLLRSVLGRIAPSAPHEIVLVSTVAVAAGLGFTVKQLLYSQEDDHLLAPCAYLIGLTFVFIPAAIALLGLSLGIVVAMGLGSLAAGFAVAGVATAGLGVMFKVSPLAAACPSVLLLSPALGALMMQRRLVLSVRPSYGSRNAPLRDVEVRRRDR